MPTYKSVITLSWKFESDKSYEECLVIAKDQLSRILDTNPEGEDFEGFTTQVDLVHTRERKRLVHLATFELDDVFPYITEEETKREYKVGDCTYLVRMNSSRYHVFKVSRKCVACGIEGTRLVLDMNPNDGSPHFNLYAEEHGRLLLMTKDHIVPKSKGGLNIHANYAPMCQVCNNIKGNCNLFYEQVNELRQIHNNIQRFPHKKVRDLIINQRTQMVKLNEVV